jgi:hypothetical protein
MIIIEYQIASEPGQSKFAILPEPCTGRDGDQVSFVGIATRRYWVLPTLGL